MDRIQVPWTSKGSPRWSTDGDLGRGRPWTPAEQEHGTKQQKQTRPIWFGTGDYFDDFILFVDFLLFKHCFFLTLTWGNDPNLILAHFWDGLVQAPRNYRWFFVCWWLHVFSFLWKPVQGILEPLTFLFGSTSARGVFQVQRGRLLSWESKGTPPMPPPQEIAGLIKGLLTTCLSLN